MPTPDDTAFLQYTSGSTSDPKGVELSHGNLIANVKAIARALYRPGQQQSTVSWLPLYHDMGLIGTLFVSLAGQVPLVLIPPLSFLKDPSCWLRAISDHRATVTVAPNFAFGYCAKSIEPEDLEGVSLDSLDCILNGAEPIDMGCRRALSGGLFRLLACRRDIVAAGLRFGPRVPWQ